MNNRDRCIIYPLLAIILAIDIAILCHLCPRIISDNNLGFDYIGIIVGILSLLVTFLIGWQIWSVIEIDNKIDRRVKSAESHILQTYEKDKREVNWISLYILGVSQSKISIFEKDYQDAINVGILALENANSLSDDNLIKTCVDLISKAINEAQYSSISFDSANKDKYESILLSSREKRATDIIMWLRERYN